LGSQRFVDQATGDTVRSQTKSGRSNGGDRSVSNKMARREPSGPLLGRPSGEKDNGGYRWDLNVLLIRQRGIPFEAELSVPLCDLGRYESDTLVTGSPETLVTLDSLNFPGQNPTGSRSPARLCGSPSTERCDPVLENSPATRPGFGLRSTSRCLRDRSPLHV
jgi:hypothetical protein